VKKLLCLLILVLIVAALSASTLDKFRHGVESIHLSNRFIVGLISMVPIFELRGAIPIGILGYHMPWWEVFAVSVIGNILPIFLILLLMDPVRKLLAGIPAYDRFFEWLFAHTRKKSGAIEKYEALGLILFVAIPLPGTGAWSGALAAYIFGLPYWKSLFCCFLGVIGAGIVVTILTLLGWAGAAIALIGVIALVVIPMFVKRRNNHVSA
jgi:uncharacterized membrane protein